MFKYDFRELGVRPMRVNHKLSPSQGWDGEPCLIISTVFEMTSFIHCINEGCTEVIIWSQHVRQENSIMSSTYTVVRP